MKRIPAAAALVLAASVLMAADTQPATTTAASTPRAEAEKVVTEVLAVLRDSKLSTADRHQKIQQIAEDNMDFQTLARLSLGAPWRKLTPEKRDEYVEEFKHHIINTYRHTTDEYTDEDIKVASDRMESDGDATVLTSIIGTKDGVRKEMARVEYRLRKKEDHWLIIDVTIEGVSLVANFRSQFQEIVSSGGIDKLIKLLKDKNASADK